MNATITGTKFELHEGVKFIVKKHKSYWLIVDTIAESQEKIEEEEREYLQIWKLQVHSDHSTLTCEMFNRVVLTQEIESTDFPLKPVTFALFFGELGLWYVPMPQIPHL